MSPRRRPETGQSPTPARTRPRALRLGLTVMVCAACGLVFSGLAARRQLEALRAVILEEAAARTGAELEARAVSVEGLRALRFEEPRARVLAGEGVSVFVGAPIAYAYVDWVDLLAGKVIINELLLEGARIEVTIPPRDPDGAGGWPWRHRPRQADGRSGRGFRVRGTDCAIRVAGLLPEGDLELSELSFDAFRMSDSTAVYLRASAGVPSLGTLTADLGAEYAGPDRFTAQLGFAGLDVAQFVKLLPEESRLVQAGRLTGSVTVRAGGKDRVEAFGQIGAEAVTPSATPLLSIAPQSGLVSAQALWSWDAERLSIDTARFALTDWEGSVSGEVRLVDGDPVLDVHGRLGRYPAESVTAAVLDRYEERMSAWGKVETTFARLGAVDFAVSGRRDDLSYSLALRESDGAVAFTPVRADYPEVSLKYRNLACSYDSGQDWPRVSAAVHDGSVRHKRSKLEAKDLRGDLRFESGEFVLDPVTGSLSGEPASGRLLYRIADKAGEFSFRGAVPKAEETLLYGLIRNTRLSGRFGVTATGKFTPGRLTFDAEVDGTRATIQHRWWMEKPPGVGVWAVGSGDLRIGKSFEIKSDLFAAGAEGTFSMQMVRSDGKWRTTESTTEVARLDVNTVGASLRVPYRVSGGGATGVVYTWKRLEGSNPDGSAHWEGTAKGGLSELSLLPKGGESPLTARGLRFRTHYVNDATNTADITLDADEAHLPALGEVWFPPADIPKELADAYPAQPRMFTFELMCGRLTMPPWEGTGFTGSAHYSQDEAGLTRYQARVGDGLVSGSYQRDRRANAYVASNRFEGVPASFLIRHMRLPPALSGLLTGEVQFSKDVDDPSTLQGQGAFEVRDGSFSADYLLAELDTQLEGTISSLPPSLRFDRLSTTIILNNDTVRTPDVTLESPGIGLTADGGFVVGGELDYTVRVSLAPDVADRIPALRDSLSISGHRIAQQNVELSFHLAGTTASPRGTLAEAPPVSVTVVTGGLEVIGEAVRVIDLPRKVLFDLLKIGGGIMGAGRAPVEDEP